MREGLVQTLRSVVAGGDEFHFLDGHTRLDRYSQVLMAYLRCTRIRPWTPGVTEKRQRLAASRALCCRMGFPLSNRTSWSSPLLRFTIASNSTSPWILAIFASGG